MVNDVHRRSERSDDGDARPVQRALHGRPGHRAGGDRPARATRLVAIGWGVGVVTLLHRDVAVERPAVPADRDRSADLERSPPWSASCIALRSKLASGVAALRRRRRPAARAPTRELSRHDRARGSELERRPTQSGRLRAADSERYVDAGLLGLDLEIVAHHHRDQRRGSRHFRVPAELGLAPWTSHRSAGRPRPDGRTSDPGARSRASCSMPTSAKDRSTSSSIECVSPVAIT